MKTEKDATQQDPQLHDLLVHVRKRWPSARKHCTSRSKPYWDVRTEISECDGLLFKSERLIVPACMISTILKGPHSAHQCVVKRVERAKTSLYWPGMQKQIADLFETCDICQENRSTNRHEPLMPQEVPAYPQQKIAAYLFTVGGKDYMVGVDYYSRWINITELKATKSADGIEVLQRQLADVGIPEELVSDNGPQFGSWEFRLFMQSLGIVHRTSSPTYQRVNGQAERMVQVAKN